MIEKIAIDLVDQMTETKLIHKDMAERYIYVANCWMEKIITIGTIILISIAVEKFLPTLFFLIFFSNAYEYTLSKKFEEGLVFPNSFRDTVTCSTPS